MSDLLPSERADLGHRRRDIGKHLVALARGVEFYGMQFWKNDHAGDDWMHDSLRDDIIAMGEAFDELLHIYQQLGVGERYAAWSEARDAKWLGARDAKH